MTNERSTYHTVSVAYDPMCGRDTAVAQALTNMLREAGVDVFFQGDLPGQRLHALARESASKDRIVLVTSPDAFRSGHVIFQIGMVLEREYREYEAGGDELILPVLVAPSRTVREAIVASGAKDDRVEAVDGRVPLPFPAKGDEAKFMKRMLASLVRVTP